jgi:ribosomal protein S18 acetylase RimI-like enzyme
MLTKCSSQLRERFGAALLEIPTARRSVQRSDIALDVVHAIVHLELGDLSPSTRHLFLDVELANAAEFQMVCAGCETAQLEVVNLRGELIRYYERLGFAVVGTAPFPKPWKLKRDAHLIVMQKER